jgi:glycosyltransferase involved in cell wall biosynthesis
VSGPSAKRRRLCIVSPSLHGGGAEYQIACLLDVIGPSGEYDIYYLAHYISPTVSSKYYRIVQIGKSGRTSRLGYMIDAMPLYRALRKIKPDVIYQRVAGGYTGICAYYARVHRIRLVWHVASDSDVSHDSSMYGRNPFRRLFEKRSIEYAVRRASCIVTQTRDQAEKLEVNYGRKSDATIPNFHPLPTEPLEKTGPTAVLWVANLKPAKRPEAFVRLAAALSDLAEVRFLMVGTAAESESTGWCGALMNLINATPNIEYLGARHQDEVNQLMARSHVFVNTSIQEGFPNTFIQAWMRQVPVVSLSINPDQVLDKEGVGIHAGSEQVLAEAVRMLVTHPVSLQDLAARAQAYAMRDHSMRNADLLVDLIGAGHANATVCQ